MCKGRELPVRAPQFRLSLGLAGRPINRDQGRERRRLGAIAEVQAAPDKADFCRLAVHPVMEPAGVRARMREQDHQSSMPGGHS